MFIPEDKDVIETGASSRAGEQQTDRVNGEYHYKNGYTQKIWSDAHYVRQEDDTAPPRYYTPHERPQKEPKPQREPGKAGGVAKLVCLCLASALLGGLGGAAILSSMYSQRIDALETGVQELSQVEEQIHGSALGSGQELLTADQVYELALSQVVNITLTEEGSLFTEGGEPKVSGVGIILSEDGYIATNYHVVEPSQTKGSALSVAMSNGNTYPAEIVASAEDNDLAVIKIEASGLSPVSFGNSDELSVGQQIYAVGNPTGTLDYSMTVGHVSALDRQVSPKSASEAILMFQIDAAVNSGNSGGPVYDSRGQVVGLVTAKYSDDGVEGIGFAIPSNDVSSISSDLITNGYVTGRAYMGVLLDERYNAIYSQFYSMPMGAYIYSVERGSCAETAGLAAGDIITRLGECEITGYSDMRKALRNYSAGDTVDMDVYRAGEEVLVTITFDELKPSEQSESSSQSLPSALSFRG